KHINLSPLLNGPRIQSQAQPTSHEPQHKPNKSAKHINLSPLLNGPRIQSQARPRAMNHNTSPTNLLS
ncbi:hypothetical protein PJP07_31060, partial [Mycobacterium kansasii]